MKHYVVCHSETEYSAWPANGGIWNWRSEILVSYNRGKFDPDGNFHRIGQSEQTAVFSRSYDGGKTWTELPFDNSIYKQPFKEIPKDGFDFSNPGFVMRVGTPSVAIHTEGFIISSDRGNTWNGPYKFPEFKYPLTSRTSYHIEGTKTMRIFMSYSLPKELNPHGYTDRAFTAVTEDGAVTWKAPGEITGDSPRSVMPIAARLNDGTLVVSLRRSLTNVFLSLRALSTVRYHSSEWCL